MLPGKELGVEDASLVIEIRGCDLEARSGDSSLPLGAQAGDRVPVQPRARWDGLQPRHTSPENGVSTDLHTGLQTLSPISPPFHPFHLSSPSQACRRLGLWCSPIWIWGIEAGWPLGISPTPQRLEGRSMNPESWESFFGEGTHLELLRLVHTRRCAQGHWVSQWWAGDPMWC